MDAVAPAAPVRLDLPDWLARESVRGSVAAALAREERAGSAHGMRARFVAVALIAAWLLYNVPQWRTLYYLALMSGFVANGALAWWLAGRSRHPQLVYAFFLTLDCALLAWILLVPNPFLETGWPEQMIWRFPNYVYPFVLLAAVAFSYSPLVVLWAGIAMSAAWSAGMLWLMQLPGSFIDTAARGGPPALPSEREAQALRNFLDPHFVSLPAWQNQVIAMLIVSGLLAGAVWRARRHVLRQVTAERARSNLARYFSPNVVDRLAEADDELDLVSRQEVAILFVDIVGFTRLTEQYAPERVIELLRAFHHRMAQIVFAHGGTVDKYIGDAVMAHFGTPLPSADDASRAIACARAMIADVARWNVLREQHGFPTVEIGVGAHWGPVVVGNVGDERCLEFTIIGDAVNVAARLERLTRELDAALIVSDDLRHAAGLDRLDGFIAGDPAALRGRSQPTPIWVMPRPEAG